MCPDKKLSWFDDEEAATAEQVTQQWWSETYERLSDADDPSQPHGSPVKVHAFTPVTSMVLNGII